MSAGVHLARLRGRIGFAGRLVDRERIHIGAKAHDLSIVIVMTAANDAYDAGTAETLHDVIAAKFTQLFGHDAGGPVRFVKQFRMGVEVLPQSRDFRLQIDDSIAYRHLTFLFAFGTWRQLLIPEG
jgi:hypothetical protein